MRKYKRTPEQIAASRANGARSRGPVTPQGKANSAAAHRAHGLLSASALLSEEATREFDDEIARAIEEFQPRTDLELALVTELVTSRIRQRRTWQRGTFLSRTLIDDAADCFLRYETRFSNRQFWFRQQLASLRRERGEAKKHVFSNQPNLYNCAT